MTLAAALIYWVIVATWLAVLAAVAVAYLRNPQVFGTTRLLLAVIALDTGRNIFENVYFGLYFGSRYGLMPENWVDVLGNPYLLIVPKVLNVIAGSVVLGVLLLRWLPTAVRERSQAERDAADLRQLATTDSLTGLANRRQFLVLAETEWQRAKRYERPLSLIMLDADRFKAINDRFGHDMGDEVIRHVANACRDGRRGSDVVARMGGEEFMVLLPETDLADARLVAERLCETVAAYKLKTPEGHAVSMTISLGVAEASAANDLTDLLKQADIALYTAKSAGRNRVQTFADSGIAKPKRHVKLAVAAVNNNL